MRAIFARNYPDGCRFGSTKSDTVQLRRVKRGMWCMMCIYIHIELHIHEDHSNDYR